MIQSDGSAIRASECRYCGNPFEYRVRYHSAGGGLRVYCSDACMKRSRRLVVVTQKVNDAIEARAREKRVAWATAAADVLTEWSEN